MAAQQQQFILWLLSRYEKLRTEQLMRSAALLRNGNDVGLLKLAASVVHPPAPVQSAVQPPQPSALQQAPGGPRSVPPFSIAHTRVFSVRRIWGGPGVRGWVVNPKRSSWPPSLSSWVSSSFLRPSCPLCFVTKSIKMVTFGSKFPLLKGLGFSSMENFIYIYII